jgi:hypothetical protein
MKEFFESDFDPGQTRTAATEERIATVLEYIAYQLGQSSKRESHESVETVRLPSGCAVTIADQFST